MECLMDKEELLSLVPHKGKMFLLDRVVSYDVEDWYLKSECDITPSHLFYDEKLKGVPSWVSFEFMAQSISCLSGIIGKYRDEKPKMGMILSVTSMRQLLPVLYAGNTVTVEIHSECKVDAVYSFVCSLFQNAKEIGSAKMTVMEVDDVSVLENR